MDKITNNSNILSYFEIDIDFKKKGNKLADATGYFYDIICETAPLPFKPNYIYGMDTLRIVYIIDEGIDITTKEGKKAKTKIIKIQKALSKYLNDELSCYAKPVTIDFSELEINTDECLSLYHYSIDEMMYELDI